MSEQNGKTITEMMETGEIWVVKDQFQAEMFCKYVTETLRAGVERSYSVFKPEPRGRTPQQNKGAHAAFRRLSAALNDAGYGIAHPFKPEMEIPYSEFTVKDLLFRPIIKALYDKESTADLSTSELSHAFDVMMGRITELTGVYVEGLDGR